MKTKLIYTAIIAVLFIVTMIVYKEQMTFLEIVLAFTSSGSTIGWVWKWLNEKEEIKEKNEIKEEFEQYSGMTVEQFRAEK